MAGDREFEERKPLQLCACFSWLGEAAVNSKKGSPTLCACFCHVMFLELTNPFRWLLCAVRERLARSDGNGFLIFCSCAQVHGFLSGKALSELLISPPALWVFGSLFWLGACTIEISYTLITAFMMMHALAPLVLVQSARALLNRELMGWVEFALDLPGLVLYSFGFLLFVRQLLFFRSISVQRNSASTTDDLDRLASILQQQQQQQQGQTQPQPQPQTEPDYAKVFGLHRRGKGPDRPLVPASPLPGLAPQQLVPLNRAVAPTALTANRKPREGTSGQYARLDYNRPSY